jgi:hypothetical protein
MTKKHFIALSKIFKKYDLNNGVVIALLNDIIALCESENVNFDKNRFLKACENK